MQIQSKTGNGQPGADNPGRRGIEKMVVTSKEHAWREVNKIFPTDYEKDYRASERAGYDIYRHYSMNHYNIICDLGSRLEVSIGRETINIWIV